MTDSSTRPASHAQPERTTINTLELSPSWPDTAPTEIPPGFWQGGTSESSHLGTLTKAGHNRRELRLSVPLIERAKRRAVYTDFEDTFRGERVVALPGKGGGDTYEFMQFRRKAQHFLKQHLAEAAVAKVRSGQPLDRDDLADLQRILVAAGVGDDASFEVASERVGNLGYFFRKLVGLDRAAAKEAFAEFLDDKRHCRSQIEFANLIIDELTERGVVKPGRIYEDPYVGLAPQGPEDLFAEDELERLFSTLEVSRQLVRPGMRKPLGTVAHLHPHPESGDWQHIGVRSRSLNACPPRVGQYAGGISPEA